MMGCHLDLLGGAPLAPPTRSACLHLLSTQGPPDQLPLLAAALGMFALLLSQCCALVPLHRTEN